MANKSEDRQGMIFVGATIIGVGVGYVLSTVTDNWNYMAACAIIGVGLGFFSMSFVNKK